MEDLLDFDDAALVSLWAFKQVDAPQRCNATSVSCLRNDHSVQSAVKASASEELHPVSL